MPGFASGVTEQGGHERPQPGRLQAIVLVGALLLASVPIAVWALPPLQDQTDGSEASLPGQVVAQGLARLPRGEAVWTVRQIEATEGEGVSIASFPIGFVIADRGSVGMRIDETDALTVLDEGEAAFFPVRQGGSLLSWQNGSAALYEIALLSAESVDAGEAAGEVVGNPFPAPAGRRFEIMLARVTLAPGEEETIPTARSGAPVLFLQTAGTTVLAAPDGQAVERAVGQSALLAAEVQARNAGDEPATFFIAAIGEEIGKDAGTPEPRAERPDRQRA